MISTDSAGPYRTADLAATSNPSTHQPWRNLALPPERRVYPTFRLASPPALVVVSGCALIAIAERCAGASPLSSFGGEGWGAGLR
ncbi:MAG: hypothetical protein WCQ21_26270 [Verrucomicrobiota bacterium]